MPNFERLKTAVDWSIKQLRAPKRERLEALKQYVGSHYADNGAPKVVPVNMLELAVTIYVGRLAARAPAVMVTTGVDELKPHALNMQLALNQIPKEIGLGDTLRMAVIEALFGYGVCKVGLAAAGVSVLGHDSGEPFVDLVSPDDYFVDMSAKSRNAIQFEGNDYWLDMDSARALDLEHNGKGLEPDPHTVQAPDGENRAEGITVDEGADVYEERIQLRDVWLPKRQQLWTYAVRSGKLLRKIAWDGPEVGPYHFLSYNDVPGNLLPLPPVALWLDLHELANILFRKLSHQAVAKKTVAAFAGGNDEDVERLKGAKDGEGITYSGSRPESITVGGIDNPTLALFLQAKDLLSYVAGNLDSLGGLGPVTETGVQDRLISSAANARMDQAHYKTVKFAGGIFEALAWYEWTDPVRVRRIEKPVRGTDMVLRSVWSEETREGDWLDYNFDVDPYSMQENTPESKLQKILSLLQQVIFPAMEQIQQQGGQLDFRALIELIARLSDLDELRDLVRFGEPIPGDPAQGNPNPSKAAHTTRTYERVNRPGATRHGKDDVMSRILMGGGVQSSEAASMGRGVA